MLPLPTHGYPAGYRFTLLGTYFEYRQTQMGSRCIPISHGGLEPIFQHASRSTAWIPHGIHLELLEKQTITS